VVKHHHKWYLYDNSISKEIYKNKVDEFARQAYVVFYHKNQYIVENNQTTETQKEDEI